jgi:hypothetical protein
MQNRILNATFEQQAMDEIINSLRVNKTIWYFFLNCDIFRKYTRGDEPGR